MHTLVIPVVYIHCKQKHVAPACQDLLDLVSEYFPVLVLSELGVKH